MKVKPKKYIIMSHEGKVVILRTKSEYNAEPSSDPNKTYVIRKNGQRILIDNDKLNVISIVGDNPKIKYRKSFIEKFLSMDIDVIATVSNFCKDNPITLMSGQLSKRNREYFIGDGENILPFSDEHIEFIDAMRPMPIFHIKY